MSALHPITQEHIVGSAIKLLTDGNGELTPSVVASTASQLSNTGALLGPRADCDEKDRQSIQKRLLQYESTVTLLLASKLVCRRVAGGVLVQHLVEESSLPAFLQQYPQLAAALLDAIRANDDTDSQASACNAVSAIFRRLELLQPLHSTNREGSALVAKLQPVLRPLLQPGRPPQTVQAALAVLDAVLQTLAPALKSHAAALESLLLPLMASSQLPMAARRLAAACVAQLPRSFGAAGAWSSTARRLMASLHMLLDRLPACGTDAELAQAALANLDAAGGGFEPLLPKELLPEAAPLQPLLQQLAVLLEATDRLLTAPFPQPVAVPATAVVLAATRLLQSDRTAVVDAAGVRLAGTGGAATEYLAAADTLCAAGLALLQLLLKVAGRAALPLHQALCRLMQEVLQRCSTSWAAPPPGQGAVRALAYQCVGTFASIAGPDALETLLPAVLRCVLAELFHRAPPAADSATPANGQGSCAEAGRPGKRQRRGAAGGRDGLGMEQEVEAALAAGADSEMQPWQSAQRIDQQATAQAAVLQLAAQLLQTVPPCDSVHEVRLQLEAAAVAIVQLCHASRKLLAQQHDGSCTPSARQLHLAALSAAAATLLHNTSHRPRYATQVVRLLRQGVGSRDAELASRSRHLLMQLEPLLHPRPPSAPAASAPAPPRGAAQLPAAFQLPVVWPAGAAATLQVQPLLPDAAAAADRDGTQPAAGAPPASAGAAFASLEAVAAKATQAAMAAWQQAVQDAVRLPVPGEASGCDPSPQLQPAPHQQEDRGVGAEAVPGMREEEEELGLPTRASLDALEKAQGAAVDRAGRRDADGGVATGPGTAAGHEERQLEADVPSARAAPEVPAAAPPGGAWAQPAPVAPRPPSPAPPSSVRTEAAAAPAGALPLFDEDSDGPPPDIDTGGDSDSD